MKRLAAVVLMLLPSPAFAQGVSVWQPFIAEASQRCGVPVGWIAAVMRVESRGNVLRNGRPVVSAAGAMGLMQLMPATWADMRAALGLGFDPFDPRDNILAGACYLRMMYDRYGYPGLFAAYNAGPGRYQAGLAGRRALPTETVDYMVAVAGLAPAIADPSPTLFVAQSAAPTVSTARSSSLFAVAPRQ